MPSPHKREEIVQFTVVEEAALVDGDTLAEVIIPMMNVPRPHGAGGVNPTEPHSQQIYITSAGSKNTFAYERLIELTILSVLNPQDYFICGAGYELPLRYGLFDKKTLEDQKMSSSFSPDGFARESQSIWTGGAKDSWFNQANLIKARSLLHCERDYSLTKKQLDNGAFYLLAVDIARYGGNDTSIHVIKVLPRVGGWKKNVVYTLNITKTSLLDQAVRIKQLIRTYRPKEVVIDGNGVGAGLIDAMVVSSIDSKTGMIYPPIYVNNDKENYPVPPGEQKNAIIYNIKANAAMNSEIYSNLYIQINGGFVGLLANERIVKEKLLATKKGQRMNYLAREKFLLPYIMTSRLIDEINNLRVKSSAAGQISVEQISRRINKDRVSALGYGLYRIKYYEDKETKKKKSGLLDASKCVLFSSKKRRNNRNE